MGLFGRVQETEHDLTEFDLQRRAPRDMRAYEFYLRPGSSGPWLLAATNRRTATDLLWECLAASSPEEPAMISHVSAANEWAVDVGMAARLDLHQEGYLGLRHMRPPAPYLHHGAFL